ncbi:hypothetical protein ESCO_003987 [Escovopsis weberi]|uniref:R3H-associated N-terminal domain-containing protein n=1 Tax=Escovopsis weberi TaxID=150374 RepID=A0A0M8NAC5_ESCWE|nr:hypothetical protein ESCO_003987 [Escovopsis weberi]
MAIPVPLDASDEAAPSAPEQPTAAAPESYDDDDDDSSAVMPSLIELEEEHMSAEIPLVTMLGPRPHPIVVHLHEFDVNDVSSAIKPLVIGVEEKPVGAEVPLVMTLPHRPAPVVINLGHHDDNDDNDDNDDSSAGARRKKALHIGHPLSRLAQANKKIGMIDDSRSQLRSRLKTQPGWRQHRRWQSDALYGVPNKQLPEPSDWEVHHTHEPCFPRYKLAARWDAGGLRKRVQEKNLRAQASRKDCARKAGLASGFGASEVPRDLREAAKRNPVVKSWVQALEEPVREFARAVNKYSSGGSGDSGDSSNDKNDIADGFEKVRREDDTEEELDTCAEANEDDVVLSEVDSEFEVILFKGRMGSRRLSGAKGFVQVVRPCEEDEEDKDEDEEPCLVLDGFGDNDSSFKRWVAHALAAYYSLESRSVTVAPAGRVVEVRAKQVTKKQKKKAAAAMLPRPMWELC